MSNVAVLNNLDGSTLARLGWRYPVCADINNRTVGILLRSYKLDIDGIPASVEAVARAGVGVNNVPVVDLTARGVPVFNTPGANANAVAELAFMALIMAARRAAWGVEFVNRLLLDTEDSNDRTRLVEDGKKGFVGIELAGRTLGVVGLGAIGRLVSEKALTFGMTVIGYDPGLSVEGRAQLPRDIELVENLADLLRASRFVSLHLPLLDSTCRLIGREQIALMPDDAILVNYARGEIVHDGAVIEALASGKLDVYVTDFPSEALFNTARVIMTPHIGASTREAEENCARMAVDSLREYLDNGNTINSVNLPNINMPRRTDYRLTVANCNVPRMISSITTVLGEEGVNVAAMDNCARGKIAYGIFDIDHPLAGREANVLAALRAIDGVLRVRYLPAVGR